MNPDCAMCETIFADLLFADFCPSSSISDSRYVGGLTKQLARVGLEIDC